MECPHCGTENLVGARLCAACGKSMFSMPGGGAPGPSPANGPASGLSPPVAAPPPEGRPGRTSVNRPAPGEAPSGAAALWGGAPVAVPAAPPQDDGPEQVMCRICRTPFDRSPGATGPEATTCHSCRSLSQDVAQMEPCEIQIPPAISDEATEGLAARMSATVRMKPVTNKKAGLRLGPVVAVVGLVLVLLTAGVVSIARREPDRAKEILGDVRLQDSTVEMEPENGFLARTTTTLRIDVLREQTRAVAGTTSKALEFHQTTAQDCEAAFVKSDDKGTVLDFEAEGRIVEQLGKVGAEDAREAMLYPWFGRHPRVRVRATATAPLAQLDDAPVTPGRDVPPLATLGTLSPEVRSFRVGDRWKTTVRLPGLVDRQGRLIVADFPVELTYAGRAVKNGYASAAFRVTGSMARELPKQIDDDYNRSSGKIVGAVWIDLATGFVAGADVEMDLRVWKDVGRVEDDLHVTGRLSVDRK